MAQASNSFVFVVDLADIISAYYIYVARTSPEQLLHFYSLCVIISVTITFTQRIAERWRC